MRVLFDVNVPRRLRKLLPGHSISTAQEHGWATIENGDLLIAAEKAAFEILITADQNMVYQQNVSARKISIIVLSTNDWFLIQHAGNQILSALAPIEPASFRIVEVPHTSTHS